MFIENLDKTEKNIFPVIDKVIGILKTSSFIFVVGDSSAVRAYTSYKRDMGDLDLIFHPSTDIDELETFIKTRLPNNQINEMIKLMDESGAVKYAFVRTKYAIDITYALESSFIIDFHVGGSIMNKKLACPVDESFFSTLTWKNISSFSGLEEIALPIPSKEEILLFKLNKFINQDKYDILSILTSNELMFEIITNRVKFYDRSIICSNLQDLYSNFKLHLDNWHIYYLAQKMKPSHINIIKNNLSTLLKKLS